MKELEDFVKPRRKKKQEDYAAIDSGSDDVYDMCDQMLEDLSYLDEQLNQRKERESQLLQQ